jgi:glycosyltransferase involved in cell wall biosynthesis
MRVLLINHFPLTGSGSGVYVANVARELQELGHQAAVLCPDTVAPAPDEYPFPVETITCPGPGRAEGAGNTSLSFPFPCFTTHPRSNRTFYALTEAEIAEYVAVFEARAKRAAEGFKAEVVHAQHLWVTSAVARRTGRPYVITSHGTDLLGYRADPRYRPFAHEGAEGASQIIAVSESTAREVIQTFGTTGDRLVALPNGVDGKCFRPLELSREEVFRELGLPAPTGPVVIYAGKLACFKGSDVLIDAASIYERQMLMATTLIVGEGAERRALESMVRALRLRGVHFIGFVDQEKLVRLYAAADVAVVPSREEPFGLAALEAMACGVPVVASAVGGLTEYVDEAVGRLVPPDNPGALAYAITEEIRTGGRKAKGPAATARGATYTWRKHAERLVEYYAKAAGR